MTLIFDRMESLEREEKKRVQSVNACRKISNYVCGPLCFWHLKNMTLTGLFFFQIGFFWFSYIASVFHKYFYET